MITLGNSSSIDTIRIIIPGILKRRSMAVDMVSLRGLATALRYPSTGSMTRMTTGDRLLICKDRDLAGTMVHLVAWRAQGEELMITVAVAAAAVALLVDVGVVRIRALLLITFRRTPIRTKYTVSFRASQPREIPCPQV